MYYRRVAKLTRDHIATHLNDDYLARAGAMQDQPIALPKPMRFDVATYVGGVVGLTIDNPKDFPALAMDALTRAYAPSNENLFTFRYDGRISGMFTATTPDMAELYTKGYMSAIDLFAAEHALFPVPAPSTVNDLFSFIEFAVLRNEHFGAARIENPQKGANRAQWIDGFTADIAWTISEPGMGQHP